MNDKLTEAPTTTASDNLECDRMVARYGEDMGIFNMTKAAAEQYCREQTAGTEYKYDWFFSAGRVVVKRLRKSHPLLSGTSTLDALVSKLYPTKGMLSNTMTAQLHLRRAFKLLGYDPNLPLETCINKEYGAMGSGDLKAKYGDETPSAVVAALLLLCERLCKLPLGGLIIQDRHSAKFETLLDIDVELTKDTEHDLELQTFIQKYCDQEEYSPIHRDPSQLPPALLCVVSYADRYFKVAWSDAVAKEDTVLFEQYINFVYHGALKQMTDWLDSNLSLLKVINGTVRFDELGALQNFIQSTIEIVELIETVEDGHWSNVKDRVNNYHQV